MGKNISAHKLVGRAKDQALVYAERTGECPSINDLVKNAPDSMPIPRASIYLAFEKDLGRRGQPGESAGDWFHETGFITRAVVAKGKLHVSSESVVTSIALGSIPDIDFEKVIENLPVEVVERILKASAAVLGLVISNPDIID